jgi:glutathione S-transferase
MKLYFTPGACSLSPHIVLHEAGLPFEAETVDLKSKKTGSGADFTTVNPKGAVPALQLDNGEVLTEGVAIVQYLADQKPETGLAPQNGTLPRYRLQEWLNFVSTELHKGFSPLFNPALPDDMKEITKQGLAKKLAHLEGHFGKHHYLMGEGFTVADAYAFTILNWAKMFAIDLSPYPNVVAFMGRVAERPSAQAAMKAEGLIQ